MRPSFWMAGAAAGHAPGATGHARVGGAPCTARKAATEAVGAAGPGVPARSARTTGDLVVAAGGDQLPRGQRARGVGAGDGSDVRCPAASRTEKVGGATAVEAADARLPAGILPAGIAASRVEDGGAADLDIRRCRCRASSAEDGSFNANDLSRTALSPRPDCR